MEGGGGWRGDDVTSSQSMTVTHCVATAATDRGERGERARQREGGRGWKIRKVNPCPRLRDGELPPAVFLE